MKINWGAKVAIMYGGFVLLILILVFKSMKQDNQLVSEDYYQKEIKYQDVINAGKNQSQLSAPILIHANEKILTIEFPNEFNNKVIKGDIQFYAASNSKWDANIPLKAEQNSMIIDRQVLHPTHYNVKINWEAEGKKYYQEDTLNLSHP